MAVLHTVRVVPSSEPANWLSADAIGEREDYAGTILKMAAAEVESHSRANGPDLNKGRLCHLFCMKIDRKSGDLVLEEGVRIGPGMQEGGFLGLELGRLATVVLQSAFGGIYHFVVEFEPGRQAGLALKFMPAGGPELIRLRIAEPGFRPNDWSGWSRNVEDERKRFHDEWLRNQLGEPPYSYPWGAIKSYIDTRFQYAAEITLVYNPFPAQLAQVR